MDKGVGALAAQTWCCRGCHAPRPTIAETIDVRIQDATPADPPLNFVFGYSLGLARYDFLAALGPTEVERDLFVGRLLRPDGSTITDWVTYHGRHRIMIRASKNVSYRRCDECGRVVYFGMGKRYLYPPPPDQGDIFVSDWSGLVVREHIMARVNLNKWKKVKVEKLPVVNKPRDSLGELIPGENKAEKEKGTS